jgi:phage terminase Nu1 subunit (DNA packaging protein)
MNISERRVQQLCAEGIIPKPNKAGYDLIGCVREYIKFLQDNTDGIDLRGEKARLTKEKADSQELKNQITRKQIAPIYIIEHTVGRIANIVSSMLESLPLKIKKRNPQLTGRELEEIKREIIKTQNDCSEISIDFTRITASTE